MMITFAVVGWVERAASLWANLALGGGVYVMVAELVVIAAVTATGLAWMSPRLKRRAI